MAINDRDYYASHGISFDIEEMQIEYTKRVIKQAKIEVLTELKTEIEAKKLEDSPNFCVKAHNDAVDSILEIIDKYKADQEGKE